MSKISRPEPGSQKQEELLKDCVVCGHQCDNTNFQDKLREEENAREVYFLHKILRLPLETCYKLRSLWPQVIFCSTCLQKYVAARQAYASMENSKRQLERHQNDVFRTLLHQSPIGENNNNFSLREILKEEVGRSLDILKPLGLDRTIQLPDVVNDNLHNSGRPVLFSDRAIKGRGNRIQKQYIWPGLGCSTPKNPKYQRVEIKPHSCDICHRIFKSYHAMKAHRRWHKETKKQCQHCKKQYIVQAAYEKHLKTHCEKVEQQPHRRDSYVSESEWESVDEGTDGEFSSTEFEVAAHDNTCDNLEIANRNGSRYLFNTYK